MFTLKQFAETNKEFILWCENNGKEATKRQASKYLSSKGKSIESIQKDRFNELDDKAYETYVEQVKNPSLYFNKGVEKGIKILVQQSFQDEKGLRAYKRAMTNLSFMLTDKGNKGENYHIGRVACLVK